MKLTKHFKKEKELSVPTWVAKLRDTTGAQNLLRVRPIERRQIPYSFV